METIASFAEVGQYVTIVQAYVFTIAPDEVGIVAAGAQTRVPVIAGGLITDKEDIMDALGAGAVSISTTNQSVWFM